MNKGALRVKGILVWGILMAIGVTGTCYADEPVVESADGASAGTILRDDAPIYSGPVEEGDLETLTAEDFAEFSADEFALPEVQYRQYLKALENPAPGSLVLYKMRIVDRDLAPEDFFGFDVPEELAQARYEGYRGMNPVTADGHTIHYVYVYHRPVDLAGSEDFSS
jgi:hypothetical protein